MTTTSAASNDAPQVPEAEAFRADFERLRDEVGKVVVGHQDVVESVLIGVFVGGHVLLEGVPGLGKTLLVRTIAEALSLEFSRVQFTPDLMPADITGTTIVVEGQTDDGRTDRVFQFRPGPIFAQIVLADEINRATPKTQSAMLEAMQERSVTVGGTTYPMAKPFFVLATQNPIEQEGTYPLPEAQLDRFVFKVDVGYSTRNELHEILDRTTRGGSPSASPVLDGPGIVAHQQTVRRVIMAPSVTDYAVRAVLATHPGGEHASELCQKFVRVGASPRAAQAITLGAKARALLDGRTHASAEDVRSVMLPALRHRVILNFDAQAEGVTPDMLVNDLVDRLPVQADGAPG
ncbi:MAG: MoxR family ATPase [Planctomycetota bacterium]